MLRHALYIACLTGAMAAASTAMAGDRNDRRVIIRNDSGYDIIAVYASNVGTDDWEEDILHRDILPDGEQAMFNFNDGSGYCRFDIKIVFEDGDVVYKQGANVCELAVLRIK